MNMKSWVLTGLSRMEMVEKPVPGISDPGEVLIRMTSIGVCGSDIHYYKTGRIGSQVVKYPFTVGHECAGIVEAVGDDVRNLQPGDRVAVDPAMPCYACDQCRAGRFHTCRNLRFLGCPGQAEGCLSEYIVMPARSCYLLKDNITFDQGALSEPLAIGVYAVRLSGLAEGAKIGILGTGPVGISVLLSALAKGAGKVYMTDKIDERLSLARDMGAHWTGNPDKTDIVEDILGQEPGNLDMVFECCGQQEAADQAIKLLKPGGKLMLIGIPEFSRWSFEADDFRRKEISVQNVRRQNEVAELTLQMISAGTIRPDRMQTHTFGFDRVGEAFELVAGYRDGVMKAMIRIV